MYESTSTIKTVGGAIYRKSDTTRGETREVGATGTKGKHTRDEPQQRCSNRTPTDPKSKLSRLELSRTEDSDEEENECVQMHWQQQNTDENKEQVKKNIPGKPIIYHIKGGKLEGGLSMAVK